MKIEFNLYGLYIIALIKTIISRYTVRTVKWSTADVRNRKKKIKINSQGRFMDLFVVRIDNLHQIVAFSTAVQVSKEKRYLYRLRVESDQCSYYLPVSVSMVTTPTSGKLIYVIVCVDMCS